MIVREKIEDLIRRKLIKISYTFYRDEMGQVSILPNEEFVNPDNIESIAYKVFLKNFKGDRLNLSCGSIVYSHNYSTLSGRENFNGKPNFFDLSKTNNEILIQPGETISIPSNERIALNDEIEFSEKENIYIGAIILPRLTLADAGLFYVPSYIDPTWDGVMQATLYNISEDPITIQIGEHLSVCKFYQVDGKPDKFFLDNFKKFNHHYALNWKNIFDGSKEPVLHGKKPSKEKSSFKQRLNKKKVKDFFSKNAMWFIGGSFLIAATSIYQTLKLAFVDFPKTKDQLEIVKTEIVKIPKSKYYEIDIIPDKFYYQESLTFEIKDRRLSTIWTKYNDDEVKLKYFKVSKNIDNDNKYILTFTFQVSDTLIEPKKLKIQVLLSE